MMLIFVCFFNYIVDSYTMFAASAMAANTVTRSAAGAAAPFFTNYMFEALGVGGGGSLLDGVTVLLAIIPFVFHRHGAHIRSKSKFSRAKVTTKNSDDEEKQRAVADNSGGRLRLGTASGEETQTVESGSSTASA